MVNQKGSALIIALLILAAISVLGIMSLNMSSTEFYILRNEREIEEVFYLSESGAMEGIQRLIDTPSEDLNDKIQSWHHDTNGLLQKKIDFRDPQDWDTDGKGQDNAMQSALDPDAFFAAIESRLATGSSAIVTNSRLYMNKVYGLSRKNKAFNIVEIGYYLRY